MILIIRVNDESLIIIVVNHSYNPCNPLENLWNLDPPKKNLKSWFTDDSRWMY